MNIELKKVAAWMRELWNYGKKSMDVVPTCLGVSSNRLWAADLCDLHKQKTCPRLDQAISVSYYFPFSRIKILKKKRKEGKIWKLGLTVSVSKVVDAMSEQLHGNIDINQYRP